MPMPSPSPSPTAKRARQRNSQTPTPTKRKCLVKSCIIRSLCVPILSPKSRKPIHEFRIKPGNLYTVGRSPSTCHVLFEDSRVSRHHCQLYLHPRYSSVLYVIDGTLQNTLPLHNIDADTGDVSLVKYTNPSLNGVFVNGNLVSLGHARVLKDGDEVSLACNHRRPHSDFGSAVGFVVHFRACNDKKYADSCSKNNSKLGSSPYNKRNVCSSFDGKRDAGSSFGSRTDACLNFDIESNMGLNFDSKMDADLCFGSKNNVGLNFDSKRDEGSCYGSQMNVGSVFQKERLDGLGHLRPSSTESLIEKSWKMRNSLISVHVDLSLPQFVGSASVNVEIVNKGHAEDANCPKALISKNDEFIKAGGEVLVKGEIEIADSYDSRHDRNVKNVEIINKSYTVDTHCLKPLISKEKEGNAVFASCKDGAEIGILEDIQIADSRDSENNKNIKMIGKKEKCIGSLRITNEGAGRQHPINLEKGLACKLMNDALFEDNQHVEQLILNASLLLRKCRQVMRKIGVNDKENNPVLHKMEVCDAAGKDCIAGITPGYFRVSANSDTKNSLDKEDLKVEKDGRIDDDEKNSHNTSKSLVERMPCDMKAMISESLLGIADGQPNKSRKATLLSDIHDATNGLMGSHCNSLGTENKSVPSTPILENHPIDDKKPSKTMETNSETVIPTLEKDSSIDSLKQAMLIAQLTKGATASDASNGKSIGDSNLAGNEGREVCRRNPSHVHGAADAVSPTSSAVLSSGKSFCLNKLEAVRVNCDEFRKTISLPELLVPKENLIEIFCATFTVDILWFLTYCEIPRKLPVTIACHNNKNCWSKDADCCSKPYSEWPNLTVIYPPFPDSSKFANGQTQGVGCHHPKLLLLHFNDFMRVVISSANLNPGQWLRVTNTVWWQDFPRQGTQDYLSLFSHAAFCESSNTGSGDFAFQLAGFLSKLIARVPTEAHWIAKLTKFDFKGATVRLVSSFPGIHEYPHPCPAQFSQGAHRDHSGCLNSDLSCSEYLGVLSTTVVGITYRFSGREDPKSARVKAVAKIILNFKGNRENLMPVLLKRANNIPADPNAVTVIIYDTNSSCEDLLMEDTLSSQSSTGWSNNMYVPLGFLSKDVADWVAPLMDANFFSFYAFVSPQEALATASGRSNNKVKLVLYVTKGGMFSLLSTGNATNRHNVSICCLIRSLERNYGLWRLQEILSPYKWPDKAETDFIYGASSIGVSLDAKFLAAFSAASGKRLKTASFSEESDPEWGCWDAREESTNPSIGIVFPTIRHVKSTQEGIFGHSRILCFSEKTWERMKYSNTFYDCIPYPKRRVNFPMHAKIARRSFQLSSSGYSFGWIYCGSHNFSPAAWGRPLHDTVEKKTVTRGGSALGSKLHIYNYEIGIVFIVSPPECTMTKGELHECLENFSLPFIFPPPLYKHTDKPATAKAMRQAKEEIMRTTQVEELGVKSGLEPEESLSEEEISDDDLPLEISEGHKMEESEDDKVYAETLWSQFDSAHS